MTTTTTTIKATTTTTTIPALQLPCTSDEDCQENAKCLGTEIKSATTAEGPKVCHCKFGYHAVLDVNPENDIYPKTGTCVDYTKNGCQFPELCMVMFGKYTYCPFCEVFETTDDGEQISFGTYNYIMGNSMLFMNGDGDGCGFFYRSTGVKVFCWFDAPESQEPTSLDSIYFADPRVRYNGCLVDLYIYIPMYCNFATN